MFFFILFFIILFWVMKRANDTYADSSIGKWQADVSRRYEQDTMDYLERKRQEDKLLNEARALEAQAKYGPAYKQRELRNRAQQLRREASRL